MDHGAPTDSLNRTAFQATVQPVNRWLIGRGLGHAIVHARHDPGGAPG
jgi:hypothetical protein